MLRVAFALRQAPAGPGIGSFCGEADISGGQGPQKKSTGPVESDRQRTLDGLPHLGLDGRESYRKMRLEPLYCPHRLSRGPAPHEREYPRRKDRF